MILDLHRQGLTVSAIARKLDLDRKTVRKYIQRGVEPPVYGPRLPRPMQIDPYVDFLKDRVRAFPGLSGSRLLREIQGLGYAGSYTSVKDALRELRPPRETHFEHRFETAAGEQAQVDFASFKTVFMDSPLDVVTVWLFTMVLGHSRHLWGEYVWHQDLLTVLRCHVAAFAALGGTPRQILYDRMKTAVLDETVEGIIYNAQLQALARHYGFTPRACAAYRAKTKGKVERPYRYIRQDFFLGRSFRNLADLNSQFTEWRERIANRRRHGTTHLRIQSAFEAEVRALQPVPALPFNAIHALERRISHDGVVSFNGSTYSVPDGLRGRAVELQVSLNEVQIFAEGKLVACHALATGRNERRIVAGHRSWPPPRSTQQRYRDKHTVILGLPGEQVARRSLQIYDRVGKVLATGGRR